MRTVIAVCAVVGGLLAGCDGADKPPAAPKAPSVSTKPEASKPRAVSEALIRYCSS